MSSFITYSFSTTPEKPKAEARSKRGEYRTHPRPKDLNNKKTNPLQLLSYRPVLVDRIERSFRKVIVQSPNIFWNDNFYYSGIIL